MTETLQSILNKIKTTPSNQVALSWQKDNQKVTLTYQDVYHQITSYAKGFMALGLKTGDRIAIFSGNRPEWILLTMAINCAGFVDVPRAENTSEEEMRYILDHSKASVVLVENKALYDQVLRVKKLKHVYVIDSDLKQPDISSILKKGEGSKKILPDLSKDDTASIIYTSGTTGIPKGVELTHYNFYSQLMPILERIPVLSSDKCLSILPAWHVFERIVKYITFYIGCETFYSTQRTLMTDLVEEKPTIMASVPRIWEVIYQRLMKKMTQIPKLKQRFIRFSLSQSLAYTKSKSRWHPAQYLKAPFHKVVDKKVFQLLRERLGGKLRFAISGGSALSAHIDLFFHAAGVEIIEGYGLTETSPVICARVPGEKVLFATGKVLNGYDIKIIDPENGKTLPIEKEGVLYFKGPNVMKGYYRNFEETKKVLSHDGWFDTGDRAILYPNGYLKITGREKDIIVLSNGENINPVSIETKLNQSQYICTAIVTGQDWKLLSALIVPDLDALQALCEKYKVTYSQDQLDDVFKDKRIIDFYHHEINRLINKKNGFKPFERIYNFRFAKPFEVGRELTMTLKPKRSVIENLYHEDIESMKKAIHKELVKKG